MVTLKYTVGLLDSLVANRFDGIESVGAERRMQKGEAFRSESAENCHSSRHSISVERYRHKVTSERYEFPGTVSQ